MTAGLYFSHPACLEHDPRVHAPAHPDTPERLRAIGRALAVRQWPGWEWREAPAASARTNHSGRHGRQCGRAAISSQPSRNNGAAAK